MAKLPRFITAEIFWLLAVALANLFEIDNKVSTT